MTRLSGCREKLPLATSYLQPLTDSLTLSLRVGEDNGRAHTRRSLSELKGNVLVPSTGINSCSIVGRAGMPGYHV